MRSPDGVIALQGPDSSGQWQPPGDDADQVCNNFARKSIRGYFHDFMSGGVDGSILSELNVVINHGLCRWASENAAPA